MALNPIGFLVMPKLLAMLVMMPCLTIWADLMGVIGGSVFGVTGADYSFRSYFIATRDALFMRDIITGLVKSIVFGLVITGVGCHEGFSTGAGSEQVGRATTSAVVTSIFLVVLVDLVFTIIFYVASAS
jgi:phospholipid/cholesterol/gamma-HCH transport system permease protein